MTPERMLQILDEKIATALVSFIKNTGSSDSWHTLKKLKSLYLTELQKEANHE